MLVLGLVIGTFITGPLLLTAFCCIIVGARADRYQGEPL